MVYKESFDYDFHGKKTDLFQNVIQKTPIISDGKSFCSNWRV